MSTRNRRNVSDMKKVPCRNWRSQGRCKEGDQCHYSHEFGGGGSSSSSSVPQKQSKGTGKSNSNKGKGGGKAKASKGKKEGDAQVDWDIVDVMLEKDLKTIQDVIVQIPGLDWSQDKLIAQAAEVCTEKDKM